MSCVIGIVDNGIITIAGERGVSDGGLILSMDMPKIGIREDIIYGYVGTIGIGQVLDFVTIPPRMGNEPYSYIKTILIPRIKDAIEVTSHEIEDKDTSWLLGIAGDLFELNHSDWGLTKVTECAIGSGGDIAMGSLYTTKAMSLDPIDRIGYAIGAAITYSPGCQGPIDVLTL